MPSPAPSSSPPSWAPLWRSFADGPPASLPAAARTDEFPAGAPLWPDDLDRRDFLKLLGGTFALAGLAGCGGRSDAQLVPYVTPPESIPSDAPDFYATALPLEGYARGVLVESHLGRPTKIEGNPDHPDSLGATDAMTQAAVLSLYDPDRSRAPRQRGQLASWETFTSAWLSLQRDLASTRGRGLALLTEPTTSPTELRQLTRALDALPEARWYQHTALARYDVDGVQPDYDFAAADVIFSIGSDFLYRHPRALAYARAFATRRRVNGGSVNLNRFYALDATPTVTSALADVRLPLSPARTRVVLDAIARALDDRSPDDQQLTPTESAFVAALARDLRAHATTALCIAGPEQDTDVQRWALAMNARLGSAARLQRLLPVARSDAHPRSAGALPELADAMHRGDVHTLLILGANPAYTAPAELDFPAALRRVRTTLRLGSHVDETAALCTWHLPESHFLETWCDLRAFDGTVTLQQPLIRPRFRTRSITELFRLLTEPTGRDAYELVRDTWQQQASGADFELRWARWLQRGVVDDTAAAPVSPPAPALPVLIGNASHTARDTIHLILRPDAKILDGRFANNPWLQELPHPITQLVWDNAAFVSAAFAAQHGLATGDLVELTLAPSSPDRASPPSPTRALTAAILIVPGHAPDSLSLTLGYGRARAGTLGSGHGFNAYLLRRAASPWHIAGVQLRPLGRRHELVSTQGHFTMEGRDLVRRVTPDQLHLEQPPHVSLFPAWPRDRYAWGMSIDLSTCIGCSACVVACQAENNIPSVGKQQVARGREMHWLRVDRYFSGDPANPQMLPQPVPCMHCENAPCEVVCPVGATVHSSEGLNDMVYNRCIGTRYCSNNCPYKVRRFNFLDYRAPARSPVHLQENPAVTIRERGVMEKCTYCVQRINAGRIAAERENRRVRDGEIRTACQQVCPVDAIVFGDLSDATSAVARRKREPVAYALLDELNTRPRTTYLARVLPHRDAPLPVAESVRLSSNSPSPYPETLARSAARPSP